MKKIRGDQSYKKGELDKKQIERKREIKLGIRVGMEKVFGVGSAKDRLPAKFRSAEDVGRKSGGQSGADSAY